MDLSWDDIRRRLLAAEGPRYWQTLEELSDDPGFEALVQREFPQDASVWQSAMSRRRFLQLMGASIALAGLTACSLHPARKLIPYVRQPEGLTPGRPLYFASAMTLGGYARGLVIESHMGRPTKIEGNAEHPISLGASDSFMQASVLDLWDPDRTQAVTTAGRISTWEAFERELLARRATWQRGAGLRLLTAETTSPTLVRQMGALLARYPEARWYRHEPVDRLAAEEGARLAFGKPLVPHYRFDRAEVVLSLDSDFLSEEPASLRYARELAAARRAPDMARLYAVEATPSLVGAMAEHRKAMRAADVGAWASALARRLQGGRATDPWLEAVASDLLAHRGTSVVVVGYQQPAEVHALGHALNGLLGNLGRTVHFTAPATPPPSRPLGELASEMRQGRVDTLLVLEANPVLTAPRELEFARALEQVPFTAHLGLYRDETAARCHWQLPAAHFLEAWSDACAYDGTASLVQPGIEPLYQGRSVHEVLERLMGGSKSGLALVQDTWRPRARGDFDAFWKEALERGVVPGTALPTVEVTPPPVPSALAPAPAGLELVLRPDPTIWDGRFANNAWLQELPKPLTKLVWDNAALVGPGLAERLGLRNGDVVSLAAAGSTVRAPIWIVPGHAEESVTLSLGYGRKLGRVATGQGTDAYALRSVASPWVVPGLTLQKTGDRYTLATTQGHFRMTGKDLVRVTEPGAAVTPGVDTLVASPSLYPEVAYDGNQWAMAIDLNACTGCSACVVACQAENNIPIVGKEQVLAEREMHWLRIDRYYEGSLDDPRTYFQPVPCMHCEKAPCEVVCPTEATVHDSEGLNEMIYNRCVGTRYCSNNCPYKVRRFNFFQYADWHTESLKGMRNPEVTVRSRGVMEKCTYCVQRIKTRGEGELQTACQQACPTRAIVFGNLADPHSEVNRLKASPRHYALLEELNTAPRTTYLARVRHPNPDLEG